jgi:hypothetical protein
VRLDYLDELLPRPATAKLYHEIFGRMVRVRSLRTAPRRTWKVRRAKARLQGAVVKGTPGISVDAIKNGVFSGSNSIFRKLFG